MAALEADLEKLRSAVDDLIKAVELLDARADAFHARIAEWEADPRG